MSDTTVRFGVTLGLLALFFGLEVLAPARKSALTTGRMGRQFGLAIISAILARLALGGGLAGVALLAQSKDWGLFNFITIQSWLAIGFSFLALDFAIWVQHLALHRVPFLWRLHRVHHSDIAMDVTTALRFHPFEILASLGYKVMLITALGAPPEAVLAFEMILGAGALFTHANIALPRWLEQPLRYLVVTPALHLIHHSPNPLDTNSNFGFSFSAWDRIFGTFRSERLGADTRVGLESWRTPQDQTLGALFFNPLRSDVGTKAKS
jgi:sterol desaturase/sphingolipid hydroxylase (fatty acid hydroxylase superfamily)